MFCLVVRCRSDFCPTIIAVEVLYRVMYEYFVQCWISEGACGSRSHLTKCRTDLSCLNINLWLAWCIQM